MGFNEGLQSCLNICDSFNVVIKILEKPHILLDKISSTDFATLKILSARISCLDFIYL